VADPGSNVNPDSLANMFKQFRLFMETPYNLHNSDDQVQANGPNPDFNPDFDLHEAARLIMTDIGLDVNHPETINTPRRFIQYLREFAQPFPEDILGPDFAYPIEGSAGQGMIVQNKIPFRGMCCHHLAPYFGEASVGYLPGKRMVGLSKLTRLVDAMGVRVPNTQEVITNDIASYLHNNAETIGTIVVTRALHTCMCVRGVNRQHVTTTVSAIRGMFIHNPAARQEFFSLLSLDR
jgi:GTP cyclohydrolase I